TIAAPSDGPTRERRRGAPRRASEASMDRPERSAREGVAFGDRPARGAREEEPTGHAERDDADAERDVAGEQLGPGVVDVRLRARGRARGAQVVDVRLRAAREVREARDAEDADAGERRREDGEGARRVGRGRGRVVEGDLDHAVLLALADDHL